MAPPAVATGRVRGRAMRPTRNDSIHGYSPVGIQADTENYFTPSVRCALSRGICIENRSEKVSQGYEYYSTIVAQRPGRVGGGRPVYLTAARPGRRHEGERAADDGLHRHGHAVARFARRVPRP